MEVQPHGLQIGEAAATSSRATETVLAQPEASPVEVVRQVARQIEELTNGRSTSSVTLQLEPEHLGKLRLTISLSEGTIHTRIVAANNAVRQMLESNSSLLQQALQERGLQLGALQVSVQGEARQFLLHQSHHSPMRGGWLPADVTVLAANEATFGPATRGGIDLLA
jgi:flagellar hook-length control protein FliK